MFQSLKGYNSSKGSKGFKGLKGSKGSKGSKVSFRTATLLRLELLEQHRRCDRTAALLRLERFNYPFVSCPPYLKILNSA